MKKKVKVLLLITGSVILLLLGYFVMLRPHTVTTDLNVEPTNSPTNLDVVPTKSPDDIISMLQIKFRVKLVDAEVVNYRYVEEWNGITAKLKISSDSVPQLKKELDDYFGDEYDWKKENVYWRNSIVNIGKVYYWATVDPDNIVACYFRADGAYSKDKLHVITVYNIAIIVKQPDGQCYLIMND